MKTIIKKHLFLVFAILWTAFFSLYEMMSMIVFSHLFVVHLICFFIQITCFCFLIKTFIGVIKKEKKQAINNKNVYTDVIGNRFKKFD